MIRGVVLLLSAEAGFAISSALAKVVTRASNVPAIELTFFRFVMGLIVISLFIFRQEKTLRPNNMKYILMRSIFNTAAVIFFFLGIQYSTVTKANLLNMTYPLFVFLIAPFINREKTSLVYFLFLILAMTGIYLVVIPRTGLDIFSRVNMGDLFALISGIMAGFAVTSLREARKYDSSYIILFYLMIIGSLVNAVVVAPVFVLPTGKILALSLLSAFSAVLGQVFITVGYKYISAAAGSVISSSRILFALTLGVIFLSEDLSVRIIMGGALILFSLVGVSGIWRRLIFLKPRPERA